MPTHPHDDPYDSMDNVDAVHRILSEAEKRRNRRVSGPDGTYEDPPRPREGRLLRWTLGIAAAAIVAALALKFVVDRNDTTERRPQPLISAPAVSPPIVPVQAMYAQRGVRVYEAPSNDSAVVRRLMPGEPVLLGERDSRQWAKVYELDRDSIGFVYVTDNFAPAPPSRADTSRRR